VLILCCLQPELHLLLDHAHSGGREAGLLKLRDMQDLVLFVLADAPNPSWLRVLVCVDAMHV
jgi:hypothetical protein